MSSSRDDLGEVARTLARKAAGDAAAMRDLAASHDLRRLVRLAAHDLTAAPFDVDAVVALTQYSVPLRYEDLLDAEPLDREAAMTVLDEVEAWAGTELRSAEGDSSADP